jgi:hypothetical protein
MLSNDQCSKGMPSGALSRGTNGGLTIRSSRCRLAARLNSGVDMTSDVKGWEQLFYVRIIVFSFGRSKEPEPGRHDG